MRKVAVFVFKNWEATIFYLRVICSVGTKFKCIYSVFNVFHQFKHGWYLNVSLDLFFEGSASYKSYIGMADRLNVFACGIPCSLYAKWSIPYTGNTRIDDIHTPFHETTCRSLAKKHESILCNGMEIVLYALWCAEEDFAWSWSCIHNDRS